MSRQLLFDENLSPRLPALLSDQFPGSRHVRDVGLRGATDQDIWNFAASADFTIVTKDDDFRGLSLLRGAPPKRKFLLLYTASSSSPARPCSPSARVEGGPMFCLQGGDQSGVIGMPPAELESSGPCRGLLVHTESKQARGF